MLMRGPRAVRTADMVTFLDRTAGPGPRLQTGLGSHRTGLFLGVFPTQ